MTGPPLPVGYFSLLTKFHQLFGLPNSLQVKGAVTPCNPTVLARTGGCDTLSSQCRGAGGMSQVLFPLRIQVGGGGSTWFNSSGWI